MTLKNKIYTKNEQKAYELTSSQRAMVKKAINAALKYEEIDFQCEISVTFTDNEKIHKLNAEYRNTDKPTDVLSFPLFEDGEIEAELDEGEALALGDIVISVEKAYEQAYEYGHSIERELCFLAVHSVFHLLGYDHEIDKYDEKYMNDGCEDVLSSIGLGIDDIDNTDSTQESAAVSKEDMRTGFICILGRPNVGKSTFLNHVIGEKVAIVSKKPQTTRFKITGVLTQGNDQFVFIDTPGIHKPKTKLGEYMMKEVRDSSTDTDAVVFIVEANDRPDKGEKEIAERINALGAPAVLVINKVDVSKKDKLLLTIDNYSKLCDFSAVVPISALTGENVDAVIDELRPFLKKEAWYFPPEVITDQPERVVASEIIREKLLRLMDDEIPHGIAVVIEDYNEKSKITEIRAEIYCEKEAHKKIIIGKNGAALKKIASYAREDIEKMLGKKVFLDLWVKVKENWRDSQINLNRLGFKEE